MKFEDFGPFELSEGQHNDPTEGMCVMEMVSFLAGEKWSALPACTSPAIAHYCIVGNDRMPGKMRQRLQTYVPRLIGTKSEEHEQKRKEIMAWAAIKVFATKALDNVGLSNEASSLRYFEGDLMDASRAARDATYAANAAEYPQGFKALCHASWAASDAAVADGFRAGNAPAEASGAATFAPAWNEWFDVLDEVLGAGPHGDVYDSEHAARAKKLKESVRANQ